MTTALKKQETRSAQVKDESSELLARAMIIIASYEWRLQQHGYPFRSPGGVEKLRNDIDAFLHPLEISGPLRSHRDKQENAPPSRANRERWFPVSEIIKCQSN